MSSWWQGRWLLLAAVRVAAAVLSLSMIHPDEFFQSQEVMARHVLRHDDPVLHAQLHLPWEYELPTPNRSVLFPSLVAGLPYLALRALGLHLSGGWLLVVPRLVLCAASFLIDAALYHAAVALRVADPRAVVLSFASSWTTLLFLTRPFSNTCETLILALCMATLLCVNPHHRILCNLLHAQTLLLGSLLALGVFTRFTFPCFFLPLGVELVHRQDTLRQHRLRKKRDGLGPRVLIRDRLVHALWIGVQGLLSFAVVASLLLIVDSWYFDSSFSTWDTGKVVFAPWNNLLYNLQPDNLALHGVHPRLTHALINLPMLFGPLVAAFLLQLATQHVVWQAACVGVPLALLSLAPHQEPRFLLPLLVPLHLFAGSKMLTTKSLALGGWIVFNVVLAVFFGVLHQGGVLPFLLAVSSQGSSSLLTRGCSLDVHMLDHHTPLVFYKTYMPPRFALASSTFKYGPQFRVLDLAGGREMHAQLQALDKAKQIIVAAPASVDVGVVAAAWGGGRIDLKMVGSCGPHVSTEDLAWDKPFALMIYRLVKVE